MKNNKGITMVALVITIVLLIIISSITIKVGTKEITSSKLENIKTNMLLIKTKAVGYAENANFKLGTNINSLTGEEKTKRIEQAKKELTGEEITEGNIFNGNANISTETIKSDTDNLTYYYKLSGSDLTNMGLNSLKSDEKNGWYIVKYNINDSEVEIYNTEGFKNNDTTVYSLTQIEQIKLQ